MIRVSIVCNCYNHEKYLRKCLDGFVSQVADFEYEVLINDDASTDNSPAIIKEYQEKYPDVIKPIYQTVNQYSQDVSITKVFQYPRVSGEYVAFCEGDDYWTDPRKLQKQVDALDAHPEVDICAHKAAAFQNGEFHHSLGPDMESGIIPIRDVILGGGGFVATNSLFFRASLIQKKYRFREMCGIDYTMQIKGALRGGMLYLSDSMSVYTFMAQGSWTSKMKKDPGVLTRHVDRTIEMLTVLNEETQNVYDDAISERIRQLRFYKARITHNYPEMKKDKEAFAKLSVKEKTRILLAYLYDRIRGNRDGK